MWDPRLSVNSLSSRSNTFAEDLALYDRLGVRRIALWLPKLEEHGLEAAVREICRRELVVDAVLPGTPFELAAPDRWGASQEALTRAVEVGGRIGASTIQITGGRAEGLLYEEAAQRFATALEPTLLETARVGLRVALEPTRPQFAHVGFVHTLADGLALAESLGLWLVPDTAHDWWEPGILELLAAGARRFSSIQVADLLLDQPVLERVVPGDGDLPLGRLLGAARAGGFDGPFELELIGSAIDDAGYEVAIRRALEHLEQLLAIPVAAAP